MKWTARPSTARCRVSGAGGRAQRPAVDPVVEGAAGRREVGRAGAVWFPLRACWDGTAALGTARAPGESGAPGKLPGLGPVGLS